MTPSFSPQARQPVCSVSRLRAAPPTVLTRPDRAQGEIDHVWPEALPGGRLKLFTIAAAGSGLDAAQIAVLDLQTGIKKVLVRGGSHAHYVASGHLVYAAAGTLRAVGFDLDSLEARGTPVPVVPDAMTTVVGGVNAVVAANGVLAYNNDFHNAAGRARVTWTPDAWTDVGLSVRARSGDFHYPTDGAGNLADSNQHQRTREAMFLVEEGARRFDRRVPPVG